MLTISALTIEPLRSPPDRPPSGYGVADFDLTGHVGPLRPELGQDAPWPMYSFDAPSMILWQAIGKRLAERGWTDKRIREWLQSKASRHALDGELGAAISAIGHAYAMRLLGHEETKEKQ